MREIVNFFRTCPALSGKMVREDYLGPESGSVAIAPDGGESVLKAYTSGDMLGQICFKILVRDNYTGAANELFKEITHWLTNVKSLPELSKGLAQYIDVLEQPVLVKTDVSAGIYEMKLRLVYYREGEFI